MSSCGLYITYYNMYCVGSDRDHMCCPRQAAAQHCVQLVVGGGSWQWSGAGQGRGRGRGRGVFTSAAAPVTRPGAGRGRGEAEQEKAESGPAAAAAARDHAATTAAWPQWQQRATLPSIGATNTGCPAVVCSVRCIQGVVLCNLCRSRVPGRRQRRGAAERRPQPEPERGGAAILPSAATVVSARRAASRTSCS